MTQATYLAHGWLAAVLPADARRIRVCDARLAYTMAAAGAWLVDRDAEVEIAGIDDLSGEAPVVIVCVESRTPDRCSRVGQVLGRVEANRDVRARVAQTAAALRRRGFTWVDVVRWDRDQPIRVAGMPRSGPSRLAEWFPRQALIVAARGRPGPTVLDRAAADAARQTGVRLHNARPIVSSGTLVVLFDEHVLRLAIGPAADLVNRQADVLVALHDANAPRMVTARVPTLFATGTAGLADWSLERRLAGTPPPRVMSPRLFDACVEFLVDLSRLGSQEAGAWLAPRVERIGAAARALLPPGTFDCLRDMAEEVDDEVRGLPRVFFHGDFSTQNLLVGDDQLVGIVDWAQGDPGGLPMLDALNLQLLDSTHPDIYQWGSAISSYLLPLARRGGSDAMRRYARAIGHDIGASQLEWLVRAYWLDRISHQLATYVDRARDEAWIERNITAVLPSRSVRR
jgi:phosphotransferase family enzyme